MYKLSFNGINSVTLEQEHFVIYIKAGSSEEAVQIAIHQYQATNIQVL